MKILRQKPFLNLFLLWLVGSGLWLTLISAAYPRHFPHDAIALPILSFFVGLGVAFAWKLFGVTHWLSLPAQMRRGLFRAYLVFAVPWSAWYGYQIYAFASDHYQFWSEEISYLFWTLLIVPVGAPICFMALLWVLAGFSDSLSV